MPFASESDIMARSCETLTKMGEIDPEYKAAIEQSPMPAMPATKPGPESRAFRAEHLARQRPYYPIPGPIPEVQERDVQLEMRDGVHITARVYSPTSDAGIGARPLYVAFHEGGWCFGDLTDEEMNCRLFSRELGAVCVNVDYRLAPEHLFPTGINDCWDALKWVARNAKSLGANPEKGFIIGGASAGGNLSAVLAHVARDEKLDPPLTGQYLCVPALIPPASVPERYRAEYISTTENVFDPVLVTNGYNVYDLLQPTLQMDLSSPLFNIMANPNGHLNLPPAYFQVCGMDPLRDEGLIYEQILKEESGVETKLDLYPGFGHMFWTNYPQMEKSRQFVKDMLNGIQWLLNGSRSMLW